MTPKGNTFPKTERLCSRKAIETLFAGGNRAFSAFPLRVVYRVRDELAEQLANATTAESTTAPTTQILISVSKRHFKHAVDRNRAKRQIREAWRLNRAILYDTPLPPLHLAFIWLSDEPQPTTIVQRKMKNLLHRVKEEVNKLSD